MDARKHASLDHWPELPLLLRLPREVLLYGVAPCCSLATMERLAATGITVRDAWTTCHMRYAAANAALHQSPVSDAGVERSRVCTLAHLQDILRPVSRVRRTEATACRHRLLWFAVRALLFVVGLLCVATSHYHFDRTFRCVARALSSPLAADANDATASAFTVLECFVQNFSRAILCVIALAAVVEAALRLEVVFSRRRAQLAATHDLFALSAISNAARDMPLGRLLKPRSCYGM